MYVDAVALTFRLEPFMPIIIKNAHDIEKMRIACRLAGDYGIGAVRNLKEPAAWSLRRLGWPGARRFAMAAALRTGVTLFGGTGAGLAQADRLLGQTHIGGMDEEAWLRLAQALPPGISEVMVHPGRADDPEDPALGEMGRAWLASGRERELAALVAPRVGAALAKAGAVLMNYRFLRHDHGISVKDGTRLHV